MNLHNKWQLVWLLSRDYLRGDRGWKKLTVGFIKIHTFPEQGVSLRRKENYNGFMFSLYFLLPIEIETY